MLLWHVLICLTYVSVNLLIENICVIPNQDSELFMLGGDSHKKKKKHSDDYYYRGENVDIL